MQAVCRLLVAAALGSVLAFSSAVAAAGDRSLSVKLGGQAFADAFAEQSEKLMRSPQPSLIPERFAEEAQTCAALVNAYKITGDVRFKMRAKTIADFLVANANLAGYGAPGWGPRLDKGYGFFHDKDNFRGKDLWETTRALDCLLYYSQIDRDHQAYVALAQKVVSAWPSVEKRLPNDGPYAASGMRFYSKDQDPNARRYVKNTNIAMGEVLLRLAGLTGDSRYGELAGQVLDAELWELSTRRNFGYHGAMIYVEPNDGNNARMLAAEKAKVETDSQGDIICRHKNPDPSCWDHLAFEAYELYQVQLLNHQETSYQELSEPIDRIMRLFRSTPLGDTQRFNWSADSSTTAITAYNCYMRDLPDPIYLSECLRALKHHPTGAWIFYSLIPDNRANAAR